LSRNKHQHLQKNADPKLPHLRQRENTSEPKAIIVVKDVSNIALPVPEKAVLTCPYPSLLHRCMMLAPLYTPIPFTNGIAKI